MARIRCILTFFVRIVVEVCDETFFFALIWRTKISWCCIYVILYHRELHKHAMGCGPCAMQRNKSRGGKTSSTRDYSRAKKMKETKKTRFAEWFLLLFTIIQCASNWTIIILFNSGNITVMIVTKHKMHLYI